MFENITHDQHETVPPAIGQPALSAPPMMAATNFALDDPGAWLRSAAHEAPLSPSEVAQIQIEIDGIIGTTRDKRSIAKLVWNGDVRYWKQFHNCWDSTGKPVGDTYKRPQVLYMSIYDDSNIFVRDSFPPRWLIMTLLEPEQYADEWLRESRFFCPDKMAFVQILPSEPPKERYIWFQTIAQHVAGCCQRAAREDRDCYGRYVHPRHAIANLQEIRKGMDESGIQNTSFDKPDRVTRRMRENTTNNYVEQSLRKFVEGREKMIAETPLSLANTPEEMDAGSIDQLRNLLTERTKRQVEKLENDLEKRRT